MTSKLTEPGKGASSPPRQLPPQAILWEMLKPLVKDSYQCEVHFRIASEQMRQLDQAPRHDSVLTDCDFDFDTFSRLATDKTTIFLTSRSLRTSLGHLEEAEKKIKGQLRGPDKVNLTDRLHRHLLEAQALLDTFQTRSQNYKLPRRPFEIRRQYANALFLRVREFHDVLATVRRACRDNELSDDSCSVLAQVETQIARVQARLGRFRDNPSQKLGAKIGELHRLSINVHRTLEDLQTAVEAECRRLGVKFFNRQGPC